MMKMPTRWVGEVVGERAHLRGRLGDAEDRGHRRVLDEGDLDACQWRHRCPERLRQHDLRHHPRERQSDRACRLGLTERHRVDAGPEGLAHEGRGVEGQRHDGGAEERGEVELADVDVEPLELDAEDRRHEGEEREHDQQRGVAHGGDVDRRGPGEHGDRPDPHRDQDRAEHHGEHAGYEEEPQRVAERLQVGAEIVEDRVHPTAVPFRGRCAGRRTPYDAPQPRDGQPRIRRPGTRRAPVPRAPRHRRGRGSGRTPPPTNRPRTTPRARR